VRADEKLTAFLELEQVTQPAMSQRRKSGGSSQPAAQLSPRIRVPRLVRWQWTFIRRWIGAWCCGQVRCRCGRWRACGECDCHQKRWNYRFEL